jgi:hypothetical protein
MQLERTPEYLTIRKIRKFLWFPKTFTGKNGYSQTLWLETVEITQQYVYQSFTPTLGVWKTIAYRRMK